MTRVHIDFISDFICPWCYLGKVRLARLKEKLKGEIHLEIVHKPYVLYPQIPKGGVPKEVFAKKTKPGMGKALKFEAEREGIAFNYRNIERIPYSWEAHRLTWLVDDSEMKYELATNIFHGYFEEGRNIEDVNYLIGLAEEIGVTHKTIEAFRNSLEGEAEVNAYLEGMKGGLIHMVPSLKLEHKFDIPGLQDEEIWERYIRRAVVLKS